MQQTNKNIPFYRPEPIQSSTDVNRYLENELFKLSRVIDILAAGRVPKRYTAPAKPREGDLVLADGTSWNPGGGAGLYYYNAGAWVRAG